MSLKTRLFHLWFLFSRPMTLGVRMVGCDAQGRVLLVKHTYVKGWHFPGGGVDNGENCNDAAIREMAEETGLEPLSDPKIFGVYFNRNTSKRDHVVVYVCDELGGEIRRQNSEILEIGFFEIDDLPHDATQATRDRVAEIFKGQSISPYW